MVQKNLQTIDLTERKSLEYIHCRNLKFVKELLVDCRKSLKLCGLVRKYRKKYGKKYGIKLAGKE